MKVPLNVEPAKSGIEVVDGYDQNPLGDDSPRRHLRLIRCDNCSRELRGYVDPTLPQQAHWRCRVCDHVTYNVKTRDESADVIDDSMEEGDREKDHERRQPVSVRPWENATKPTQVLGVKLRGKVTRAALVETSPPRQGPLVKLT